MCWTSRDIYIKEDTFRNLFLKKSRDNIYTIFLVMELKVLKDFKFKYVEVEFHLKQEKGYIYFSKYMEYKGGRTILSCIREMVKYLLDWRVKGLGHFSVSL